MTSPLFSQTEATSTRVWAGDSFGERSEPIFQLQLGLDRVKEDCTGFRLYGKGYGWTLSRELNKAFIFLSSRLYLEPPHPNKFPRTDRYSFSLRVPGGMRVHVKELSKLLWC
ncbi:hypothetical protein IRJ41_004489 [Triplophysa rosa]|uniref:Uncharacterized protein n=1 Tax=Triplophysa rosa TaxID=992332 RepID=A0A9W7T8N4_TRIRA|nr:hypothetical protein IRJ41_004489 [Triplophysa rosa]